MAYCIYCDESARNNPFTLGYAERVHAILWLQPWRWYHKIPLYGVGENFAGTWPTINYKRERCTR